MEYSHADQQCLLQGCARLLPRFAEGAARLERLELAPGLDAAALTALEVRLEFELDEEVRAVLACLSLIRMDGFCLDPAKMSVIRLPENQALLLGEFFMYAPGDRLLMLPGDEAIYYLEQRNGSITMISGSLVSFFEKKLARYLPQD